uniref:Glycosyltransferase RgtA/B/C/D-like domain-containing protein n=1 Tax=Eubacterium plexicaudatum ASF492 TaxID=1235802 RepID=N2AG27_9FIRM
MRNFYIKYKDWDLKIGMALFVFVTALFVIPDVLFFFQISVTNRDFFIGLVFMIVALYYITGKNKGETALLLLCVLICIGLSIWFSGNLLDTSYDGNGYRKIMTGLLKEGWNPIWHKPDEFNEAVKAAPVALASWGDNSNWFWMDVHPKALAVVSSVVYAITGNIESGKFYTLISIVMVFCFYNHFLRKHLKLWQAVLMSAVIACNPVAMTNIRNYYGDGFIAHILMIAVVFILEYFDEADQKRKKGLFAGLALCIIWGFNLKINAAFYLGILCTAMWIIVIVADRKKRNYAESRNMFVIFSGAVCSGVLLGFSPYVTSIYRYGEFLPGVLGNSKSMTGAFHASTQGMYSIQIFWAYIFGKMGDYWTDKQLPLKIPFTVSEQEIENYCIAYPAFESFGLFFSGLLIISFILLFFLIICFRKTIKENLLIKISLVMYVLVFAQCMFSPTGIGLRYVAHFWLCMVYPFILGAYFSNQLLNHVVQASIGNVLIILTAFLCFMNIFPYFKYYDFSVFNNTESSLQKMFCDGYEGIKISFLEGMYGMCFNLRDAGIELEKCEIIELEMMPEGYEYICGGKVVFQLSEK